MKNSMNSSSFMMIVWAALLCLWITPTFSQLKIEQNPNPAKTGDSVSLTVTGVNVSVISSCNWFIGYSISEEALISLYIRSTNQTKNLRSNIAVDDKCTLRFTTLLESDIARYTLLAQFPENITTARIVINGAERYELSSIVLLAVAGLVSSFTLF